jgi:hypothetical protein
MGFEEPRFSLIRANSVDQTCIAQLAVLGVPVPESSGADVVLVGEVAGRVPSAFAAALRDPPLRRPLASAASERSLASASRLLCGLGLRCTWFTLG